MSRACRLVLVMALVSVMTQAQAQIAATDSLHPDPDFVCNACEGWNESQNPFLIHGNTYYVGTAGLAALLVAGQDGQGEPAHVLLDGGLTQSAALIDANIRALGFDTRDVHVIVNSHAHFDHAGGIAALQRYSGAEVRVSQPALEAFRTGQVPAHDPQAGYAPENGFPPVDRLVSMEADESFQLGGTGFTLHQTPGHTPGSSSWSWESCAGGECLNIIYADSLGPVASPGFRFSSPQDALNGATTAAQLQASIEFLAAFDCDIMISPHPFYFNMNEKLAQRAANPDHNPFHQPQDCAAAAKRFQTALDARLQEEADAEN